MSAIQPPLFIGVNGEITAADLGLPFRDLIAEGVMTAGDFAVSQRAAGANMSVDVAKGAAWVKGDDNADTQPTYRVRNDAVLNVAISAADGTNPRIDRIVARVYDSAFAGTSLTWDVEVIKGTATSGANLSNLSGATAVPHNALLLANVLVPAGAASIVTADISDQRVLAASALPQAEALAFGARPGTGTDATFGRMAAGILGGVSTGLSTGPTSLSASGTQAAGVLLQSDGTLGLFKAATSAAFIASLVSDTGYRFQVDTSGEIRWGPGNAAPDTAFGRLAAGVLGDASGTGLTTGPTTATPTGTQQSGTLIAGNGGVQTFGAAGTTFLASAVVSDTQDRFVVDVSGHVSWGPGGNAAVDTTLYRAAAGRLQTDGVFLAAGGLSTGPTSNAVGGGGTPGVYLDDSYGYILSTAPSASPTAAAFAVGVTTDTGAWRFEIDHNGKMFWGPGGGAFDVNLARTAAGVLTLSGALGITGNVGFYGTAPVARPGAANNASRSFVGATVAHLEDTFTGGTGTTAYTIGDIVRALKLLGLITS